MTINFKFAKRRKSLIILGIGAALIYTTSTLLPNGGALASWSHKRHSVQDTMTTQECGACHMAYPATFLSAETWKTMMDDLPNHFGEDASLDEASRQHITGYLTSNASRRGGANTLRISEQRWFLKEHHDEVSPWQMQKAKTWANCPACHIEAEAGNFDD